MDTACPLHGERHSSTWLRSKTCTKSCGGDIPLHGHCLSSRWRATLVLCAGPIWEPPLCYFVTGWRPSKAAMVPWRWFCAHSVLEWCRGERSVRFWFRAGAVAYVLGTFRFQMGPWLGEFQRYDLQLSCGLRELERYD